MNLSFPQFISVIRGEMPEQRRSIVKKAYDRLARPTLPTLRTLFDKYQYENHPYVLADEMELQDAIEEFQENIQIMIGNKEGDLDVCVNWETFIEFYRNYSAVVQDDEEFVDIVTLTWDLAKEVAYTSEDIKQDFRSRFY